MEANHRAIAYSPALDGLRAVCLTGVLLFHAPFSWMGGGFLGVSTFFTLSGYLIATLLIREARSSGSIGLRVFWDRRLRRLGPALWLGVVVVLLSAPYWLRADARERLLPDALSTLLFASNWRFQSPEYAYAQLFTSPSPLQHSWSLSIEAQYYLVFPVVLALCTLLGLRALHVGGALLVTLAASVAAAVVDPSDADAVNLVYYGTLSRVAEPLMGALLALVLSSPRAVAWVTGWQARKHLLAFAGFLVAAAMALVWSHTEVTSAWLYRGGFALHALLSAMLILVIVGPTNPFERFLSLPPLPWLGRLSYGAYVYHWPIFLLLSANRTGLTAVPRFGVRVAVTIACAWLSHRYVEQPIRQRRILAGLPAIAIASLLLPACIAATIAWQDLAAPRRLENPRAAVAEIAARIPTDSPPRFAIFGDSSAFAMGVALKRWMLPLGVHSGSGRWALGCSFLSYGQVYFEDGWTRERPSCGHKLPEWKGRLDAEPLDFVVVMIGPWDVLTRWIRDQDLPRAFGDPTFDRALAGALAEPRAFGDPSFDQAFARAVDDAIEMFADAGTAVIWIAPPPIRFSGERWADAERLAEANDPKRMARLRALLHEAAARWPKTLRVVDLHAYLEERTNHEIFDPELRPDGVHFSKTAMASIVESWLGPAVLVAADELVFSAAP